MEQELLKGFAQAREITRNNAKTFYFASLFLPKKEKLAAYSVYAVCRLSDNAVDKASGLFRHNELIRIGRDIESAYKGPGLEDGLLRAFRSTVREHNIPQDYFLELLSGMRMDLEKNRYADFNELYGYCYKVAGVVGLMMLKILGDTQGSGKKYAEELGVAMQLTNILRDIREDSLLGRIYLPQDELHRFGVDNESIGRGELTDRFKELMRFQIQRARDYYSRSLKGIPLIPGRRNRFVVLAMHDIYSGILDSIEANRYDVFTCRAHVTTWGKMARAAGILMKGAYL